MTHQQKLASRRIRADARHNGHNVGRWSPLFPQVADIALYAECRRCRLTISLYPDGTTHAPAMSLPCKPNVPTEVIP